MTAEIGELTVRQYISLANMATSGQNGPLLQRALDRHGSRASADYSIKQFAKLLNHFAARFGADRRVCLYESPGRVNLMGMHVDHRGGIVNPVATGERIRAVCGRRTDDVICARSLSHDFGEGQFRVSERLPAGQLRSLGDWLNWTETEAATIGGGRDFINYLACGPLYAACFVYEWGQPLAGADFVIDSDLPPSAGLSSSSAIVVAATDFFLRCNPRGVENLSVDELLDIYGYGEWYIGTRGGCGDQAAIKLSQRGAVQPIITTPRFRVCPPAPIPKGYDIVLYQSGDQANKSVEPFKTGFNAPIISYQAAEALLDDYLRQNYPAVLDRLLADRASLDAKHRHAYLGDVVNEDLLPEPELYRFLRSLPRTMTQEDVFKRFEGGSRSFLDGIKQATEPEGGYHVRDACAFGLGECARSKKAAGLLADGDVTGFAHMMNVSQLGDRVEEPAAPAAGSFKFLEDSTLAVMERDRVPLREVPGDYHVSTPNVDRLVSIALACPGVLGARLSGAGLGGMVIVLGEEGFGETLDPILIRDYYEPLGKEFHKIPIVPSEGAGFY